VTVVVNGAEREEAAMLKLRDRLAVAHEYATTDIDAAIERAIACFADARVREFVPLLVERLARADLRALVG
jgi:hypothetical protein